MGQEFQWERVPYRWSCSPAAPVTKLSQSHRNLAIDMDSHRKFSWQEGTWVIAGVRA